MVKEKVNSDNCNGLKEGESQYLRGRQKYLVGRRRG